MPSIVLITKLTVLAMASVGALEPAAANAKEPDENSFVQAEGASSNSDGTCIKIGPEHVASGETVYPARRILAGAVVVDFSKSPTVTMTSPKAVAPRLADLIGDIRRQEALDRSAKPGDFVTPPAVSR
jgi:hypothetical protein